MGFSFGDLWKYTPAGAAINAASAGDDKARAQMRDSGANHFASSTQGLDNLSAQLMAQAQGQGPSMADQQNKMLFGRAMAQQQAMAASARPGQEGMAQRLMMQNQGHLAGQQAQAGTLGRLQEQDMARQALLQALLGGRGQDVGAWTGAMQQKTGFDKWLGAAGGAAKGYTAQGGG